MKKWGPVFLVLFLLISCHQTGEQTTVYENAYYFKTDTLKKQEKEVAYTDFLSDIKLIPLETNDSILIGEINKVLGDENSFYILDAFNTGRIFRFDKQGKFLNFIGKKGNGPGEFNTPLDFIVFNDKVLVLNEGGKIIEFDKNGNYKKTLKLPELLPVLFTKDESHWFFVIAQPGEKKLWVTDDKFKIKEKFFNYRVRPLESLHWSSFFKDKEGHIYYFRKYDKVYAWNGKTFLPYITLDFGSKSFHKLKKFSANIKKQMAGYAFFSLFYRSGSGFFAGYMDSQKPFLLIYDFRTNNYLHFPFSRLNNNITRDNMTTFPVGYDGDFIIFKSEVNQILNAIDNTDKSEIPDKLKKIRPRLHPENNPVLIAGKISIDNHEN